MVERRHLKKKPCFKFLIGRCARSSGSCPFAHGESERRPLSDSFRGNPDFEHDDLRDKHFRNDDLRSKLDRKHKRKRVHSPVRDERSRNTYNGGEHERGRSRSPEKERKHREKRQLDHQSDISGSLKISDEAVIEGKERKFSTQSRRVLVEKLKQVEHDVNWFDRRKFELLDKLESKAQEVESLNSTIQVLKAQLFEETEETRRILSKINEFVKAYNHHTSIQDQLKKSEAALQKLGDHLGSDIEKISKNQADDPSISCKMGSDCYPGREPKQADSGEVHVKAPAVLKKDSRSNIRTQPSSYNEIERKNKVSKLGASLSNISTPSEEEEVKTELEDNNLRPIETLSTGVENEWPPLVLPPLPPILNTNYSEYEGDDECIDVGGVDDEMVQLSDT